MESSLRKRASLREVAQAAHTSVATVSRVLNNTGYIADETRLRVQKAADELNYQPNLRAKGLRTQRSHSIGLLIPNLLNAYYTTLADAISMRLNSHGYQLLLSSTRDDPLVEQAALRQLIGHDVEGLIWVPTAGTRKLVDVLLSQHIPSISIVRRVEGDRLDTIVFEDFAGSAAAMQHLIQLGHRRIGFIGGDTSYTSNYERWQGYLAALKEANLQSDDRLVKLGAAREPRGSIGANELLSMPDPPTALFVASNVIVTGVMKVLQQVGVRIPEEMSLICFDDLDWFTFLKPTISAVATSHNQIAEAAIEMLFQHVENPDKSEKAPVFIKISFELMLRNSTTQPRQAPPPWIRQETHPQKENQS